MVRFIKTFTFHYSIDELTDKERKINVIFQRVKCKLKWLYTKLNIITKWKNIIEEQIFHEI